MAARTHPRLLSALLLLLLLLLLSTVHADLYMQNPRGSNNRLNEKSHNRNNANRLFDSQNNAGFGYNVGDRTDDAFTTEAGQGQMEFYESSILFVEWWNQHGCGAENNKTDCEIILQYMCGDHLRDGLTTDTVPENSGNDRKFGVHETAAYYSECKKRERNKGLYTADQNLNNKNTAIYTRQNNNNNNNRHGFECTEERDYYPYWHPSPWKDIAVLTNNLKRCAYYQGHSQNVRPKNLCSQPEYNNIQECVATVDEDNKEKAAGSWDTIPAHGLSAPECVAAPNTRENHVGMPNEVTATTMGLYANYRWAMPSPQEMCGQATCSCVLRMRYNISTHDFDGWSTFASSNAEPPVKNNPTVDIGVGAGLRLATDTSQFFRTFQDRSHVFVVKPRPAEIPATSRIWNLNVRGKRGNIVEAFPAVEYDFVPTFLDVNAGDYVHFQWTGSNTHNNGNNAGDGQAGDSGQGTSGTDRTNVVQIEELGSNFPLHLSKANMFTPEFAVKMATVGKSDVDELLNNAPATFDAGPYQFNQRGTFCYMCTRNNSFSNRSQKGCITVR